MRVRGRQPPGASIALTGQHGAFAPHMLRAPPGADIERDFCREYTLPTPPVPLNMCMCICEQVLMLDTNLVVPSVYFVISFERVGTETLRQKHTHSKHDDLLTAGSRARPPFSLGRG